MKKTVNSKAGSVYPFLDARTPMANSDLLPVKISVNLKGVQFRVGIKLYATTEVFDKAMSLKGTMPKESKTLKAEIDIYLGKANQILEDFPNVTKKMFTNLFKSETALKVSGKTDMAILFQSKIDELTEEDKAGSKCFYEQALLTFQNFRKGFYLEDITVEWLKVFESWWHNQGNAVATAQIHMRCLRHIYNRAIKVGYISQGLYPFKEHTIGSSSKSKDVLYPAQIQALWNYQPLSNGQQRSKDYFIFLYLCNGMNIKDALSLKGSHIKGDMINFVRVKTSRTKKETKEITVYMHPEIKRIIQKWGSIDAKDYLFPCFRGLKTDIERKKAKDIFARNLNRDLRPIGEAIDLPIHLTLNLARHSFATRLKIDGTPTTYISDALEHGSSAVTEHYLKSLPDNKFKEISETLLTFK